MEKLKLDTGVQAYKINGGGILRFNPADPNLYARFLDGLEKIQAIEAELIEQARGIVNDDGAAVLRLMSQADGRMKAVLSQVFGPENDFDEILGGVNLLAVAGNGQRVVTNLFRVLEPILAAGVEQVAQAEIAKAGA